MQDRSQALLERSLELNHQVLIECDTALRVFAQHGRAQELTVSGRLLPALERVVQASLQGETKSSPFALPELPEFRLLQVDARNGVVSIWLRHTGNGRALFSRQLRERYGFKRRSQQLLTLLTQGLRNREIAEQLGLRETTVKTYLHEVYETLGVNSRTQAIAELRRTLSFEQL